MIWRRNNLSVATMWEDDSFISRCWWDLNHIGFAWGVFHLRSKTWGGLRTASQNESHLWKNNL